MIDTCLRCGQPLTAVMVELVSYPDARVDEAGGLRFGANLARPLDRKPLSFHHLRCSKCEARWDNGKKFLKEAEKLQKKDEKERKRKPR